ncbi:putative metal-dependent protease of the PAD1/JAB1 superfamily [Leptolyngbyaceae cyanobacterium JSC-12]|nr:putative metal-dependent protease of the PAD1/JAB1 superfamily [Leptolyngbyaceae cyanobacterium JSC-12]
MSLTLRADHLQVMRSHAEQAYPNECCGFILGILGQHTVKQVVEIRAVENAWDKAAALDLQTCGLDDELPQSKTHRYWVDPQETLAVMREARSRNLDIIGIYHSHPDHPAVPSECDRQLAWRQYSYVIISVQQGAAQELSSWQLSEVHQFQPEAIKLAPSLNQVMSTLPIP